MTTKTEGLCDAAEVNRCDNRCGDIGDAVSILCEDCPAPSTCSRRIYNLMVCDPIDWSQGGNGGEGGGE